MKDPVKRLIQTIIVAILFLVVYTGTMLYTEKKHYDDLIMADLKYLFPKFLLISILK